MFTVLVCVMFGILLVGVVAIRLLATILLGE